MSDYKRLTGQKWTDVIDLIAYAAQQRIIGDFVCDKVEKFAVGSLRSDGTLLCNTEINRAPQSWCYVEELKEKQK